MGVGPCVWSGDGPGVCGAAVRCSGDGPGVMGTVGGFVVVGTGYGGGVELRRNCDEAGGRGVVRALPLALDVLVGHGRGEATTTTTTTTCTAVNAEV